MGTYKFIDHKFCAYCANYDAILMSAPDAPAHPYGATYVDGLLVAEAWVTITGQLVKTIAYTYDGAKVATEVRTAYDPESGAMAAQVAFDHTAGRLS